MNLQRTLNSVGKACFVRYFEVFSSEEPIENVLELLLNEEGYTEKASRTRISNARKIIRNGLSILALQAVIQSKHSAISPELKNKAQQLIQSITK